MMLKYHICLPGIICNNSYIKTIRKNSVANFPILGNIKGYFNARNSLKHLIQQIIG